MNNTNSSTNIKTCNPNNTEKPMLPHKTRHKEYCLEISHGIIKTMLNDYIKEHKAELPETFEITGFGQSYDENKDKICNIYFSTNETEEYYPCDGNTKPEYVNIFQFINMFTKWYEMK